MFDEIKQTILLTDYLLGHANPFEKEEREADNDNEEGSEQ